MARKSGAGHGQAVGLKHDTKKINKTRTEHIHHGLKATTSAFLFHCGNDDNIIPSIPQSFRPFVFLSFFYAVLFSLRYFSTPTEGSQDEKIQSPHLVILSIEFTQSLFQVPSIQASSYIHPIIETQKKPYSTPSSQSFLPIRRFNSIQTIF